MKKVLAQVKPNHASKLVWAQFHGLENFYQGNIMFKHSYTKCCINDSVQIAFGRQKMRHPQPAMNLQLLKAWKKVKLLRIRGLSRSCQLMKMLRRC